MRFFLSTIFYFFVANSMAQPFPDLRFHKINDDVLQGADIGKFFPTRDGLLWFGTNKGLASFDGSEMMYYGNKGLPANTNYRLIDLCEDKNGNLWFIAPEYGLLFFDRRSGIFKPIELSIDQKITSSQIHFAKVLIDRQGIVWIGTGDRGFFSYDPVTTQYHHYNFKPEMPADWVSRYENTARNILQDRWNDDVIWLACYGCGIYSFNKKTKQLKRNFRNAEEKTSPVRADKVTGLFQLNDSIIWFHTWGYGMGEYNIRTGFYRIYLRNPGLNHEEFINGHVIEYAAQKSDSEFFVAPRDTIPAIFNIHTKRYTFIRNVDLDREIEKTNNVQVGSDNLLYYLRGGSLFISSPRFNLLNTLFIGPKKNKLFPELNCILWEGTTQRYYAGILLGEGVNEYDKNLNLLRKIPMPPYTSDGFPHTTTIWKLHRDKAGYLWALGFITSVYDSASQRFVPVKRKWPHLNLLDSAMNDVGEDKNGLLYFSTYKNELIEVNPFLLKERKISIVANNKSGSLFFYDNWVLSDTIRNYIYFTSGNHLLQYNTLTKKMRNLHIDATFYRNSNMKYECSYTLGSHGVIWMSSPDHYLWKIDPVSFKITDTIKFPDTNIDINGARLYGAYNDYLLISTYKSQLLFNTNTNEFTYLDRNNGLLLNRPAREMVSNGNIFMSYAGTGKAQYAAITSLLQYPKNPVPYFSSILINNQQYVNDTLPQFLKRVSLNHNENSISISFSTIEPAFPNRLQYAYKLDNTDDDWSYTGNNNRRVNYANLSSGNYVFRVKVREWGLDWSPETTLSIAIVPPFWKTWWFISLLVLSGVVVTGWLVQWRINSIRGQVQLKAKHEKELLELEARALRAQMNPHFIFNCLNSIKSLIQQNNPDHAVMYLTTFSKLIRTIFQNSAEREVSLFDEMETCKLYVQLEGMRFGNKLSYQFHVDESVDLKSIKVPALIIQPFIENAIWHGIMPKEKEGKLNVTIEKKDHSICCIIDDNGIGRELSRLNKFNGQPSGHQSKGIQLTQSRLDLNNTLSKRNATVMTTDKKDERGKALGTTVVLTFKEF